MKSVTVIGAGGNIGSHLVAHLGRMPGLGKVTLVDKEKYESANLRTQDILPRDVGHLKALAQARRLRRINPCLEVDPIVASVEAVPLSRLRADVLLACLDSRRSRLFVNEAAWRLGLPWIDAGVRREGLLARVNVYVPGQDRPCLLCPWSETDFASLEQSYPCAGEERASEATNAPSSLGALAAALQALECMKLLEGETESQAVGRQVTIDARWHKHYVTSIRRNPGCRFDHKTWNILNLKRRPRDITVGEAVQLGGSVELERKPFARKLVCPGCGRVRALLHLVCALKPSQVRCRRCGKNMAPTGFDLLERLDATMPEEVLCQSLKGVGLRAGDVFHAGNGSYYEIA